MTSAKADTLSELKDHHLTKVIGRKPNHQDVETWEEEASEFATLIKTTSIQGGQELGHLAIVISEEEYRLEIEDEDWEYEEPTDPGPYNPDITGNEGDHEIRRMEAEHKQKQQDFQKYQGVSEHLKSEFQRCMDSTWIAPLKRPHGGFANVTIKAFLAHLRANVAKLTTKQKKDMKKKIEFEWDQTKDISEYFTQMEETRIRLESWGVTVDDNDMVNAAVAQMQDSGLFDRKFLREWEQKDEHEKTWEAVKEYYKEEYDGIKQFKDPTNRNFESINSINETNSADITDFMDELRRDTAVSQEQIQQMSTAFKGTAETMSEVMDRLKQAMDEIKVLNNTVSTLTTANKQLADALKALGGKQPANPTNPNPPDRKRLPPGKETNPEGEKCTICDKIHGKPFTDYCYELDKNKHMRPRKWKSGLA
jgi:DNA repair exonuclease SbcCD ATPase subunit